MWGTSNLTGAEHDANLTGMPIIRTLAELHAAIAGDRPVFVPTMGALHSGHLSLIKRAGELRSATSTPILVSIFVNPTQFGPNEDYARYPRMLEVDSAAAFEAGAQIVFAPTRETVYPPGQEVAVPMLPAVATEPKLEDAHRPTHFAGVCQVVARLFDLVQPSIAVFGEKDYQQLRVIQEMVRQERHRWPDLTIVAHPTVREAGGLAMSSRNAYLSPQQREAALGLSRALDAAVSAGSGSAEMQMREVLERHELQIDYAAVRDALSLMPIESNEQPKRALIAARIGGIRLIDNMTLL